MNIAHWLDRAARRWPGAAALLSGTEVLTDYAGFQARAGGFARWLAEEAGIAPGDRVAIFMKNCPEYLVALFGIWKAGAVAVPVNAKLHPREASWIIEAAGARLVLLSESLAEGVVAPHRLVAPGAVFARAQELPALPTWPAGPQDLAWLFYTSGTTGRPKGVMITHAMLAEMSLCYLADVDEVAQRDAALYAAPMSHGAGLYALVHVLKGAGHICPPSGGFDTAEFLQIATEHGSVSAFLAPTMVHRLTHAARAAGSRGEGLRTVVYGGGPMYRADIEAALDHFGPKFVQIYGQGECPMGITALSRDEIAQRDHPDWAARITSVGRAQSAVEVRILREDGSPADPGEIGEIAVQGSLVMPGYWQAPEATAETLAEGWLHTGDRGAMTSDGYVTLHDRSKDVIISGGTNIYPREVEEALLSHPLVDEVAVIGRVSAEWGEDVVACVVLAPGADCTEAELDAHCLASIARFKRPKAYRFLPALPKNAYGKVLKTELRAKEGDETAGAAV
ncbi:class I adenylate-forming enzyme family protein [Allosediminivita pacifica]|uniref:Long-chain acyl-CoA synthetase n=1 Tax=Allosediminivita pacifica TaxID=1267769 RepID=A0A2T6A3L8_9RHOB|nr:AMP-binding protein [Allosediminivita pacifica]PTX38401.1 long-chain acyl-CoA synthetase [Allosediminivita pacifica]GGB28993.1 AMP-dependent synthetase [Allosediminivita pacifica]